MFGELSVFAGGFTLAAMAAVCCGGDQAAALDLVDQLAAKSLVVAEPAAAGTRYRLLETIRQYAADRLAETGEAGPGPAAARRGVPAPGGARTRAGGAGPRAGQLPRRPGLHAVRRQPGRAAAGPGAGRLLAGPRIVRRRPAAGWSAPSRRAPPTGGCAPTCTGCWARCCMRPATWSGPRPPWPRACRSPRRIRACPRCRPGSGSCGRTSRLTQDGNFARAIEACEEAAALLESEGDLEGLAEAWLSAGKLRFFGGDTRAAEQALQRAAACARQSGNHRAEQEARTWLAATLWDLPIPFDVAVGRAERLLEAAAGDPWDEAAILGPLALTYGYAGRFADARAAYRRAQAVFTASGAKLDWAHVRTAGRPDRADGRGPRRGRADPAGRV